VRTTAFIVANGAFTVPGRTTAVFVVKQTPPTPTGEATLAATRAVPTPTPEAAAPTPTPGASWVSWALGGLAGLAVLGGAVWAWLTRRQRKG
jgi:hypothetical protein